MLGVIALDADPAKWFYGPKLLAHSRETFRRHPIEHGIFIWAIHYRLASDGMRARPVVAFRMAFDRSIHRFENRFRPEEPDSAVATLTPEVVRRSILDPFRFYELHADADQDPFGNK